MTRRSPPCVVYAQRAPLGVAELNIEPAIVSGGQSATGTILLTGPAPAGGISVVVLVGSPEGAPNPPVHAPSTVSVSAGAYKATFTITTDAVMESGTWWLSAGYGGLTAYAPLEVDP